MRMPYRAGIGLAAVISFLLIGVGSVFSQEAGTAEESADSLEIQLKNDGEWLWGDVLAVDLEKKEIKVKHLDYETYTEKEIIIAVDAQTTYENVRSLEEIKPQDTVSIDYAVDSKGKNAAKNISVEKLENTEPSAEEGAFGEAEDTAGTAADIQAEAAE